MAAIDSLTIQPGPSIYYDDGFRNTLEDHMTYLRTHPDNQTLEVTPIQAHRYEFDLIGLLNELVVPMHMHWVVARVNNFDSFTKVPQDLTFLILPDQKEIARIQQTYSTVNGIN